MTIATIENIIIEVNSELTKKIYSSINMGGALLCKCAYCRNFIQQIPSIFPQKVIEFFELAGIDPYKDAEIYHMGSGKNGLHRYGGEYYFIAKNAVPLESITLKGGFQIDFTLPSPLTPDHFRSIKGASCFSFVHEIPWILQETP